MMATTDLARLATWTTWGAAIAFVLSGFALALFFAGAGELWGPTNDVLIAIAALALVPAVLMVARMAGDTGGPWVRIVSILAIAGLVLMAVGQLLLVVGRLTLEGSYVTGGIGVIPFLAWVVLTVVLSLASGVLPDRVGWLAIASLVSMVVLAVTATVGFWTGVWVDGLVLLILFGAWMAELARAFSAGAVVVAGAGASA